MRLLGLIGLLGLLGWGAATPSGQNLPQQTSQPPQATDLSRHLPPLGPYGHLPLSFEANQGQTDDQVQFLAHGQGYQLFLTACEAVFAFRPPAATHGQQYPTGLVPKPRAVQDMPDGSQAVVRMQLLGANPAPQVVGLEELPGKANYFRGNDPQQWRTNVPTYAKVKYAAVYPGVDLVYYSQSHHLEYDFLVAPGADPTAITLGFEGVDHIDVDAQGDLVLSTAGGSLHFQKPVIYQEGDGRRQAIAGSYVRKGLHQVGFHVAAYDPARPLVIDPVLSYSTYLGGSGQDIGYGIAVDAAGHAYVTGSTGSPDFPIVHPLQAMLSGGSDAFVTKLTADGTALVYATYLGGRGFEDGFGIAVDAAGAAYVTGDTNSPDFPTVHPLQPALAGIYGNPDAFVAKLTADGSALVYSTYLGGSGGDQGAGIAVDIAGAAYVTGSTASDDFPTVHPLQPTSSDRITAFVAKLTADGTALVYATYLGGSRGPTGLDIGTGIAVDAAGAAYVTGDTIADGFPTVHPVQPTLNGVEDAFVAKLTADGSALVYSTYLGGSGVDRGTGIAVDATGAAYVTGNTDSPDFPTVHPLQPMLSGDLDAFVVKFTADGTALVYVTYLGGRGGDSGTGIAVDATGAAYVTGNTDSPDFPTVHPVQHKLGGGVDDAFVAKLNAAGTALVYATYLGGSGQDEGAGIAVDAAGAAYVTGNTNSPDFPTVHPVQPEYGGGDLDAFVAKLVTLTFAGTPGMANCQGESVSALAREFGGLEAAAAALGFSSVQALQDAIREFCEE